LSDYGFSLNQYMWLEVNMAMTMPARYLGQTIERAFNRVNQVNELETRIFQLERYLTTQHAITQIIAQSSQLESALPNILQAICQTTDWDFGEVWQVDRDDNVLHCTATWCVPTYNFPAFAKSGWNITFESGKGLPGRAWASGKPAWIKNVIFDSNFMRGPIAEQDGLRGGLAIPIRTEGEVIGVMTFFSRQPRQPDRDLLRILDTVGSQIGLFVERKRIELIEREQARKLAILEDRQRLARDLHDSVTQSLFSATVIAEMLPIVWNRDPEQIKPNLEQLHHLTSGALSEMRDLLVELRPAAPLNGDLSELLQNLANTFKKGKTQVKLNVCLSAALSADEQITLYRITQEALNNITKHADATLVSITLIADHQRLELCIEDNGRGFEPAHIPDAHFGVAIMRERAETIGAHYHVESSPGKGTRLHIIRSCSTAA
jgi:signal transduction histidine kinase